MNETGIGWHTTELDWKERTQKSNQTVKQKTDLHEVADGLPLGQDLGQVLGAQDVTQGGGCQKLRGPSGVLHVVDGGCGVVGAEVDHGVHRHRHGVTGQHLAQGKTGRLVSWWIRPPRKPLEATNRYLQCGNGKRCAFPHATNDVRESILAECFSVFLPSFVFLFYLFDCLFCLILENKVTAPNESKLAQAVFIHKHLLIAILPPRGGGRGGDERGYWGGEGIEGDCPQIYLLVLIHAMVYHCNDMVMFPVHQVWPKPSCKAQ